LLFNNKSSSLLSPPPSPQPSSPPLLPPISSLHAPACPNPLSFPPHSTPVEPPSLYMSLPEVASGDSSSGVSVAGYVEPELLFNSPPAPTFYAR
jgi:hypothetical protein